MALSVASPVIPAVNPAPVPRLPLLLLPPACLAAFALALFWDSASLGAAGSEVLLQLRLPRLLLAAFTGGALALAGLLMQDFFRNPLVEPGLLGVSAGAGLGAVIVISLGLGGLWLLPLAAFAGALGTLGLVLAIGRRLSGQHAELLLAGVALNALAGALVNLLLSFGDPLTLRSATFWLLGSFAQAEWALLGPAWALLGLVLAWSWRQRTALDVWQLGEAEAVHLGLPLARFRRQLLLAASLLVALAVAQSGGIGFVGLLAPHMARRLGLFRHRELLPATLLLGMLLAVLADWLARTLIAPLELPVGVLTALLGAPAFLLLFLQRRPA